MNYLFFIRYGPVEFSQQTSQVPTMFLLYEKGKYEFDWSFVVIVDQVWNDYVSSLPVTGNLLDQAIVYRLKVLETMAT